MPCRTIVDDIQSGLKRVVLGTFDWRGRARRTDGVLYYIAASISWSLLEILLASSPMSVDRAITAIQLFVLLSQLPLLAWSIRRVHDYGASGFLLVPFILWAFAVGPGAELIGFDDLGIEDSSLNPVVAIAVAIGFFCILLWNPSEGENRFGPNPRLDAPDQSFDAAQ